MENYIKSTKQKIVYLESEISKSDATDEQKRNMQHTLSKINIFSDDVFDNAIKYRNKYQQERRNVENDSTKFAEWVSFEGWVLKEMDLWSNKIYPNLGTKTSNELFVLYIGRTFK